MQLVEQQRSAVTIRLLDTCADAWCVGVAGELQKQLGNGGYNWPMSVLPLERDAEEWLARLGTARKRATFARYRGYGFRPFERSDHQASVNVINRSMPVRQGRPMGDSYMREQVFGPVGEPVCERHRVSQYGVFNRDGLLRAYAVVHRSGELALVSQILGHGDYLEDGIMHLLLVETYAAEQLDGGYLVYNRHDSGTEGLRQFKEWFRFSPMRVEWRA